MNKVILIGRTTADAEIRVTNGNITVARFTVAIDRVSEGADFINCIAFGSTADFIEQFVNKGKKIAIEGRWETGSYTNKEGQKVYTNNCIVDRVEFCEKKQEEPEEPQQEEIPKKTTYKRR